MAISSIDQIQQAYIAYYGRPADPNGLTYWANQLDKAGGNLSVIINAFGNSAESTALYGGSSLAAQVNKVYNTLFGRDADSAGLNFYVQGIQNGQFTLASVALNVFNGAQGTDKTGLESKLAYAKAFTAAIDTTQEIVGYSGDNAANAARAALAPVKDAASLEAATANLDTAVGSVTGQGTPGQTFTLTSSVDTINGTAGNDTINAGTVSPQDNVVDTLNAFDVINGGAGNDTLNIYASNTKNASLSSNTSVSGVETVNIYNGNAAVFFTEAAGAGKIDASKFAGATAINQLGTKAAAVEKLAAGTVAGFQGADTTALSVTAADAAATAQVNLKNVAEGGTLNVLSGATGVLNSVTVTGNALDTDSNGKVAPATLNVTVGKDVQTLTVNTSLDSTLTVTKQGKEVTTIDASASTGGITFAAGATALTTLKTGAGNDTVTLSTALAAGALAANVATGAGNDTLTIAATNASGLAATVAADAGAGNDKVAVTIAANTTYDVKAGAGDDHVAITGTVKTTDKIDGGEGNDTVELTNAAAPTADDYIVFNKVLTNFEGLKLNTATTAFDATKLATTYTTIDLADTSVITGVSTQALVAHGGLNATANGFAFDTTTANKVATYAGTLNITEKAAGTVTAFAETINVTVGGVTGDSTGTDATQPVVSTTPVALVLAGEAKAANITLAPTVDTMGTVTTADDARYVSSVSLTTVAKDVAAAKGDLNDLASLTIKGNGTAAITSVDKAALVTIDASGLNSVNADGTAAAGLTFKTTNTSAETIKLGAGLDQVNVVGSTVAKTDTIEGLKLVKSGVALDAVKSDVFNIGAAGAATAGFVKFATSQTDLDLALKDAAAYVDSVGAAQDKVVFQLGGNTYVYQDTNGAGGVANHVLDAGDVLVKLVGNVDLDALVLSLNTAIV